jgi:hypothetical protein
MSDLKRFKDAQVDIPEPLINAFRKRVRDIPLHFDHSNLLVYKFLIITH